MNAYGKGNLRDFLSKEFKKVQKRCETTMRLDVGAKKILKYVKRGH